MQKENEMFVPVKGFEGRYEVSNMGRVRSKYKYGGAKMLKLHPGNRMYLTVNVITQTRAGRVGGTKHVHRLVAEHFVHNPCPERFTRVNHLDGDKYNNNASNLEWCDHKGNMIHAFENGLVVKLAERHYKAKFSNEQVAQMRAMFEIEGKGLACISHHFGINYHYLGMILTNKKRKYG